MGLLQSNAIPAVIQAVQTGASTPVATVAMTIAGLSCYMLQALRDKSKLYIVGNTIGLVGNTVLLICIL